MIARRYYIDRMTKENRRPPRHLAPRGAPESFGKARESGLVRIDVGGTTQADIELGETLSPSSFHLRLAVALGGAGPAVQHGLGDAVCSWLAMIWS